MLEKITERTYADTRSGRGGNVGIIILEDKVIVVDSRFPITAKEFKRSIFELTNKPITHLILTHYHMDHILGCQEFKECKIVAHRKLKEIVEENLKNVWSSEGLRNIIERIKVERPESLWLYEGLKEIIIPNEVFEEKYFLNGIEVINTGGHTEDSSIVYVKDEKVLFSGDLIFAKSFPWGGDPTANPDKWIQALKTILEMNLEKIVPGHGPICGKEEVENYLNFMVKVKETIYKLIREGLKENEITDEISKIEFYQPTRPEFRRRTLEYWCKFWSEKAKLLSNQ